MWRISHRADPKALKLADKHYSRQKPGTPQFVPPGSCFVLLSMGENAVWVTSWPFQEYVRHNWAGAWINSMFRNEGPIKSSDMIRQAVAHTRWFYGKPPYLGMISFVDGDKVKHKRDPGRCFIKAGFKYVGKAKDGKLCFQMLPEWMPEAAPPFGELAMKSGA